MALDKHQLKNLIERVLTEINLNSPQAVDLLLGTCAQESAFGTYLRQTGGGPALGAFQIEPATFQDLRGRYGVRFPIIGRYFEELEWDLRLSIIVSRVKYFSCPGPIPLTPEEQAAYYKKNYNTPAGSGTVEQYMENWRRYVA